MRNSSMATLMLLIVSGVLISSLSSSSSVHAFSQSAKKLQNSRYVMLMDDYTTIRGPYFNALWGQLQEQIQQRNRRIALCTSQVYANEISNEWIPKIQEDLLLDKKDDCCTLVILDDYNPLLLQEKIETFKPSIFWLVDDNVFRLRYKLRTSGLDGILAKMCGPPAEDGNNSCLYVGENAGSICAGASLATAYVQNQDPKQAPEPQFRGLELLGQKRSISVGISKSDLFSHPKVISEGDNHVFIALKQDDIFVWSQPPTEDVTSFVFLPLQRGGIENWASPPPVPPLVEENRIGGVQCDGEPSIDPSRMVQQIGDSEWINEVDG